MTHQSASAIYARFVEEQDYINRYIKFAEEKSSFDDRRSIDLNTSLRKHGVPKFAYRTVQEMTAFPLLSRIQLSNLVRHIEIVEPTVIQLHHFAASLFESLPYTPFPDYDSKDDNDVDSIDFVMMDFLYDVVKSADFEPVLCAPINDDLVDLATDFFRATITTKVSLPNAPSEIKTLSSEAKQETIRSAIYHWLEGRVKGLEAILAEFEEVRLTARAANPGAEINVLRQGFILLNSAFDAAVFDLVRIALPRRFFVLMAGFGKQDKKFTLQEIVAAGSPEQFQQEIIDEQLKKCYIKDLLGLLNGPWRVQCVNPIGIHKFERLIEIVLRRNLHVHNRGIVDSRYTSDRNLDSLNLGDVAAIDNDYWNMTNDLCGYCVAQVANWAGA